jgi:hypothetical protein
MRRVHFIDEKNSKGAYSLCCSDGDSCLEDLPELPLTLRRLFTDPAHDAREFRSNIRAYNAALAFTSVSYKKDTRIDFSRGLQTFQIHGDLYHYQGPLEPGPDESPAFAQLFFYDPEYATGKRLDRYPQLNRGILIDLLNMLTDVNPFIKIYQTARERLQNQPCGQFRLLLNPQMRLVIESGADRRRENLPTSDEIAAVLPDEYGEASRRDILLAARDPRHNQALSRISVTHAAYMPLHYVLLFPGGTLGWHYGLQLRQESNPQRERIRLGQRQFYRYRLHFRRNGPNRPCFLPKGPSVGQGPKRRCFWSV